jgi:hypothetical protein
MIRKSLGVFSLAAIAACGGGDGGVAWFGPDTHLTVSGSIASEVVSIDMTDPVIVADGMFECRREYIVPVIGGVRDYTMARNIEVRIRGHVVHNGEPRRFELELKQHNLQDTPIGTTLQIVPRDDLNRPDPNGGTLWVEWEWHDSETNDTTFESSAQGGTVRLEAFTGMPDADGVIIPEGEGYVGATVDAFWSPTERLRISVTAPCLDTEIIEEIVP